MKVRRSEDVLVGPAACPFFAASVFRSRSASCAILFRSTFLYSADMFASSSLSQYMQLAFNDVSSLAS